MLDDLHNFFPELLYNSGRFQSVQDVLQYIVAVTRRRFDLFSYGSEIYSTNLANAQRNSVLQPMQSPPFLQPTSPAPQPSPPAPQPVQVEMRPMPAEPVTQPTTQATPPTSPPPQAPPSTATVPRRTYASLFTPGQAQPSLASIFESLMQPTTTPVIPSILATTYATTQPILATDEEASSWLVSLLSGGRSATTNLSQLPASFLEPVPVFPSRDQIRRASSVRTLDATDSSDTCTICQDEMSEGNTIRTLNTCQHSFHISCIDTWLIRNVRCPVCRHDIRELRASNATDQKESDEQDTEYADSMDLGEDEDDTV